MAEKKKGIAPEEVGDLPNEKRCPRDWTLLGQYEKLDGTVVPWCPRCQTVYPDLGVKGGESNESA